MAKPYLGRMPVRHLTDQLIRPIEHSSWADARRYFKNRPKHWAGVEQYLEEIRRTGGVREPLLIAQSKRYPEDFYIGDGHHRAVALREVGGDFPFHWYVIPDYSKPRMSRDPFPFDLLNR